MRWQGLPSAPTLGRLLKCTTSRAMKRLGPTLTWARTLSSSAELGQVGVLEDSGVVTARREDDRDAAAGAVGHRGAEQGGVVAVVAHVVGGVDVGRDAARDVARDERVGRAGGDARVVLEHHPRAVRVLHEVLTGDVGVDARGRHDLVDLRQVARAGEYEVLRDHLVADDLLLRVDVAQKCVERPHALGEAALEPGELVGADDARDGVVGEELLVELATLVDAEAHAVAGEVLVDGAAALDERLDAGGQRVSRARRRAWLARRAPAPRPPVPRRRRVRLGRRLRGASCWWGRSWGSPACVGFDVDWIVGGPRFPARFGRHSVNTTESKGR